MAKSRRISIELIENDPNTPSYDYDRKICDADGKCTRVELRIDAGTDETGGCQTTYEYKKGHISADEAAKLVRNMVNDTSTKKKFLFKSIKGGIELFSNSDSK